jgi:hypothetical protein
MIASSDEEFAARIGELLEDAGMRRALAERARSWARRNLTWDAPVDAYLRLYAELIERVGARPPS